MVHDAILIEEIGRKIADLLVTTSSHHLEEAILAAQNDCSIDCRQQSYLFRDLRSRECLLHVEATPLKNVSQNKPI